MNLIRKILKKFEKNNYKNALSPRESFRSVMSITEINLHNKSDSEKITMLDYIIDILKVDICSSGIILEDTDIYVRPWNVKRQLESILNLKDKNFVYNENNHWSYYYNDINLCYVFNGNHSVNAGRYLKKGKIISECCDITMLYPHCYTDGIYWYNSHTNNIISGVDDFRLATIYELAKKRYFIRNNIK